MRSEIKYVLYLVGLGASLVAYANFTFATKEEVRDIKSMLRTIDQRVYDIHSELIKER